MNKYEIISRIERFAPVETAEKWDCVGFMVETSKQDINKVMLCLTVTDDVIKQAHQNDCDMIISHHPLFYVNCHCELVSEAYVPMIDIYSAHTNLDKAPGGTTDTLIKTLGLDKLKIENDDEFLRVIDFGKDIEIDEFSQMLVKVSPNARIVNNKSVKSIKRVAFCAGSGSEFISDAKQCGADVLVTGDLKFHTALDSEIVVYDIGHFESEILILPVLKDLVGQGVEVVFANEASPFKQII